MDVNKILTALRQERTQIEQVIINLELLALSRERRRGRPPAIFAAAKKRGRPRGSKNKTTLAGVKREIVSESPRPLRALAAGGSAAQAEIAGS